MTHKSDINDMTMFSEVQTISSQENRSWFLGGDEVVAGLSLCPRNDVVY